MIRYLHITFFILIISALFFVTSALTSDNLSEEKAVPRGWPLAEGEGRITSVVGKRRDPFTGEFRFHNGVDIAAKTGTSVFATADGKVIEAETKGTRGLTLTYETAKGYIVSCTNLSKILVEKGDTVSRGQEVAYVGNSGRSTAPHLHYEIYFEGEVVNPEETFGFIHGTKVDTQ